MSDISTVKVSGPVRVLDASKERVAFDLWSSLRKETPEKQNEALLFYRKCLKTVSDAATPKTFPNAAAGPASRQDPMQDNAYWDLDHM